MDEFICKMREEITTGVVEHVGFTVHKGLLVIQQTSKLILKILEEFHGSMKGGHVGESKMYQRLAVELYWVNMRKDIQKYVQECQVCQQNKYLAIASAGLLQPIIPLPHQVWDEITLDFIEGLLRSEKWDTIIVVVDCLSKYTHFIALRHPFSAATVADIFVREIVQIHGILSTIILDRDKIFMSYFWTELFRLQSSILKRSTAYHP